MKKYNTIGKGSIERGVNGGNDKYYTKQFIADYYSNVILERFGNGVKYIEPTAGDGAFMNILPNIIGYDLKPERDDIIQMDIFKNTNFDKNSVVVGNPPFGMSASFAQKIFNYLAGFEVKGICFIVPKTFKKVSLQNKLSCEYSVTFEQDVMSNAFTVDGINKDVPCVFQIWERRKRKIIEDEPCEWLDFKNTPNVCVRRVGGKAGKVLIGMNHNTNTTYFIHAKNEKVIKALKLMSLKDIDNTAGVRSISMQEICKEVNKVMEVLK